MLLSRDKPEVCIAKIEPRLRKELGATNPLSYKTELDPDYQPVVDHFFRHAMEQLRRDGPKHLFMFVFDIEQPREMTAFVNVVKTVQSYVLVNRVLYVTSIAKAVKGAVKLGESLQFEGDTDTAGRLNSDKKLTGKIAEYARTELKFADRVLTIPRYVSISPDGDGSLVAIQTTPKLSWFGMKASFESMVFIDLVGQIEAAL